MKRSAVIMTALLVIVTLLAVMGCGGDTAKAKEYMEKGDELSIKLTEFGEKAADDVEEFLVELGIDLAITGTTEYEKVADEAKENIDGLIEAGEKAKKEYQKILSLDGVEDYKEYADLRIEAIGYTTSVLESLKGLVDQLGEDLDEGKDLKTSAADWAKENKSVIADAAKGALYWGEAAALKENKNL